MRFQRPMMLALVAFTTACAATPKYQGMTADEVFAAAQREFDEGDWGDAIEALERVMASFPNYERMPEVRLLSGRAYYNDEKYYTAAQEFRRFLDRHPGDERAPEAALWECRSYVAQSPIPPRDQTYTEQAVLVCQNVVRNYTGIDDEVATQASDYVNRMRDKLGEKAYINSMFYFDRELYDASIIFFEMVVDRYGDTAWAPRALAKIMEAYEEIGYEDEVERYRQQLLRSYPDSPEARAVADDQPPARDTTGVAGAPVR